MKYAMTKPCAKCPFRSDIRPYLRKGRVREIELALERGGFPCHATVDYSEDDDSDGEYQSTGDEQHCAGALILLEKLGRPSQMMRIMERLGGYDASKLEMAAPVYGTFTAMVKAQSK